MDVLGTLPVRFHFNGEFITSQKKRFYCGGKEEISHIDRDKVSLPEIWGHLKDHYNVNDRALLHWLFPSKDLINGLRVLVDDTSCIEMANTIVEGGVADIYVEAPEADHDDDLGHEPPSNAITLTQTKDNRDRDIQFVKEWYSPSKLVKKNAIIEEFNASGSDYLPSDEASSEEDEEASEIVRKFKKFKSKFKAGDAASLDDVVLERPNEVSNMHDIEDDGNATSYEDSYGEDDSVEELSDGEVVTRTSTYPRYNKNDPNPKFEIGMKFSGKRQFKKAVTKHGLVERRFIRFMKNEADRMSAKCDWATCQWRCMASVNSRSSSWQIASLKDVHTCPPRRHNRLVTAARIAEKYDKMIIANPSWSIEAMKATVLEEMFADVHDLFTLLGCQDDQRRREKGSQVRNQNQQKFQELAQSSDVGNASKLVIIGQLVTKEMVQLKLVTDQPVHRVVLLQETTQALHPNNHLRLPSPLNKAVQPLELEKGRHHLAVLEMHQQACVPLQQKNMDPLQLSSHLLKLECRQQQLGKLNSICMHLCLCPKQALVSPSI